LIIIAIDKSFENSIENILNHPYLCSIYVSCIKVAQLHFLAKGTKVEYFLFECLYRVKFYL
jgi:uncharacterized membrane protein